MGNDNSTTHSHNQTGKGANYLRGPSSANTVETTQIGRDLTMLSECDVEMSQTSAHLIGQLLMSQTSAHLIGQLSMSQTFAHLISWLLMSQTSAHLIDQLSMSQISAHLIGPLPIRSQKPAHLRRKV